MQPGGLWNRTRTLLRQNEQDPRLQADLAGTYLRMSVVYVMLDSGNESMAAWRRRRHRPVMCLPVTGWTRIAAAAVPRQAA